VNHSKEVVPITRPHQPDPTPGILHALAAADSSTRLQAALAAGTHPVADMVDALIRRCAVEPDFFVRDMLTWALARHPTELVVPELLSELHSETAQARSQALHTLSKIGDASVWPDIPLRLLHDSDDDVARAAWRTAVALVPTGREGEVASELATELGRGDRDTQRSLSRALIALGDTVPGILEAAARSDVAAIRAHAKATDRLWHDPDSSFTVTVEDAKKIANAGPTPDEKT
jgi:HEAT repeat protein